MIKWCKHCCSLKIVENMFFLKHATESSFLISIGVLFQMNSRPGLELSVRMSAFTFSQRLFIY